MKTLLLIATILLSGITFSSTNARSVTYEDAGVSGNLMWDTDKLYCPTSGAMCTRTIVNDDTKEPDDIIYSPSPKGIFITTTVEGVALDVTGHIIYGDFTHTHTGENFTFGTGWTFNIQTSDEYPMLNGLGVSLNGITTDGNGEYTVFFPIP